jgi:hypothetical protein
MPGGPWQRRAMKNQVNDSKRDAAMADLRRLTRIILDNLEEGSRNRLLDPKEIRLLAVTVNRSIRLYLRTLERDQPKRRRMRRASQDKTELTPQEEQTKAGQA